MSTSGFIQLPHRTEILHWHVSDSCGPSIKSTGGCLRSRQCISFDSVSNRSHLFQVQRGQSHNWVRSIIIHYPSVPVFLTLQSDLQIYFYSLIFHHPFHIPIAKLSSTILWKKCILYFSILHYACSPSLYILFTSWKSYQALLRFISSSPLSSF